MEDSNDEARNGATEREKISRNALASVRNLNLPNEIYLPKYISGLTPRANVQYSRIYHILEEDHGEDLPKIFALSWQLMWVACWDGAHWFKWAIEHEQVSDTLYCQDRCTATGYAESEGWAYTLFTKISDKSFAFLISILANDLKINQIPTDQVILTALELNWLHKASQDDIEKSDFSEFLFEAGEAGKLANNLMIWEGAQDAMNDSNEAFTAARKLFAKAAAKARHAPSRAMREQVIARYKIEKYSFSSKDNAAIEFTKEFPVEFTTIRAWLKGV